MIKRNHEDAEDCLQEALTRAFTRIDQFEEPRILPLGLSGFGVNQALTCLRPNKKSFLFSDTADEDSLRSLDSAGYLPRSQIAVPSRRAVNHD
jgi:DNA-directed RNA polymerase specialized sigma24 family protein